MVVLAGYIDNKHYTAYCDKAFQLKKEKKYDLAIDLLFKVSLMLLKQSQRLKAVVLPPAIMSNLLLFIETSTYLMLRNKY